MTITLRTTKGSELSFAELDGNFTDLDGRVQDSNDVRTLIDSAYIQARADSAHIQGIIDSSYVTGIIDSAYVQGLIDSDYVQSRTKQFYKFFYEADSGDTVFTGADLQSNVLSYDSSTIMVYKNGMLLHELYDFTLSGNDTVTLTLSMDSGHDLIITTWK